MRKLMILAVAGATTVGCAGQAAQQRQPTTVTTGVQQQPVGKQVVDVGPQLMVPAGTVLRVELTEGISGRDMEPGERFTARVTSPVVSHDGQVLIPDGARVVGHVAALQEGERGQPPAAALTFDSIQFAGVEQPLSGNIVEAQVPRVGTDIETEDVAAGAAIGAILGSFGDVGEGTLIGAGLGAGAGTLVSLGRGRDEARLPEGTTFGVELTQPVDSFPTVR